MTIKDEAINNLYVRVSSKTFFSKKFDTELNKQNPDKELIRFYLNRIISEGKTLNKFMKDLASKIRNKKIKMDKGDLGELNQMIRYETQLNKTLSEIYAKLAGDQMDINDLRETEFPDEE